MGTLRPTDPSAAGGRGRMRLQASVAMHVGYDDRTPFGSPLTQRPEESVRRLFAPVLDHIEQHGYAGLPASATPLLEAVVHSPEFAKIAQVEGSGWSIASEVLYPNPADAPAQTLTALNDGRAILQLELPRDAWPSVHALLAALTGPGVVPAALGGDAAAIVAAFAEHRLLSPASLDDYRQLPPPLDAAEVLYLGHNTVLVRSGQAAVIVDPFLSASSTQYPEEYQPLPSGCLPALAAVLVTHAHPDHFDPGSLLRFPPNTPVVVPRMERETLLSAHLTGRTAELGFTDIIEMGWGESRRFGDIEVVALPFYGEQPAEVAVLHPEIRNAGNTYLVRTPQFSAVFLADSGRDPSGDAGRVATQARGDYGPVDLVFAGYRGWLTYPIQLLFSSVARFLLLVPPSQWEVRQRLMIDTDEAVDLAERWGARYLVPYADGGAPWHWERGLGPRLDGTGEERVGFDPFPERVVEAARHRVQMPDGRMGGFPGEVLLLRPNDGLVGLPAAPRRLRAEGYAWPWGDQVAT